MRNRFVIREYRRIPVHCSIFYWYNGSYGQGTVWNFSKSGWRVDGNVDVRLGSILTIFVFFSGLHEPLKVEEAMVRWSRGKEFGLENVMLPGREEARLWLLLQQYPQPFCRGPVQLSSADGGNAF